MYLWLKPFLWARVSYAITYLTILCGYLSNILKLTYLSKTLGPTITLLPKSIIFPEFFISVKREEEIVVMEMKEYAEDIIIYLVSQSKSPGNVFASPPFPPQHIKP